MTGGSGEGEKRRRGEEENGRMGEWEKRRWTKATQWAPLLGGVGGGFFRAPLLGGIWGFN